MKRHWIRKVWITLGFTAVGVFLGGREAWAWGAGFHIMQGTMVLENLQWIAAGLAHILDRHPKDYLYGCLSADIFIGKGSRYHHDHCHNWAVGKKMLARASSEQETALAYGYLSHLAADIVAHNIYVPNQLYLTSSSSRLGHVYWEVRAEAFTDRRHWQTAEELMLVHNQENDLFIQDVIKQNFVPFETKKRLFLRAIRLFDLGRRRQADMLLSRNSRWEVTPEYIEQMNRLCLGVVIDFLNHPEEAICLQYDPIGSDRLASAKQLRRISKQLNGRHPTEAIFEVPTELAQLAVPACKQPVAAD